LQFEYETELHTSPLLVPGKPTNVEAASSQAAREVHRCHPPIILEGRAVTLANLQDGGAASEKVTLGISELDSRGARRASFRADSIAITTVAERASKPCGDAIRIKCLGPRSRPFALHV
jgi:hypothetical protein